MDQRETGFHVRDSGISNSLDTKYPQAQRKIDSRRELCTSDPSLARIGSEGHITALEYCFFHLTSTVIWKNNSCGR